MMRMIEIGPRGAERGHPFFRCRILAKKAFELVKKELDLSDLSPKKKFRTF